MKNLSLRFDDCIYKFLFEVFIFNKRWRSKLKARWAKHVLRHYMNKTIEKLPSARIIPPEEDLIIWQYWHQGRENAPEIVQKCLESVEKYEGNRTIKVLSFDTIKDYVDIPQIYYDYLNSGKMKVAHFSDILRLYLLEKYGGVWIDSTILLTERIPQEVIDSDYFVVQKNPKEDYQENNMSCYFIRAKKCCANMYTLKAILEDYWKENDFAINYFMFEHLCTMLSARTPQMQFEWEKMPYLSAKECGRLQDIMDKDFSNDDWNEIKSKTFMHKLTYKKEIGTKFWEKLKQ